ncbi:ABC transporter ATP-binding protein [Clostridium sp. Cult2]|uniref:ABC transporter ATP-binding protein n=1 Tax=Clostridium sp. Cult2 TaxID=2079003 RepID=UPI001F45C43D|nr:ABC transporter ATP-binding protein [Clostridium sp. Cult2]MCF6466464.1 ABC transporter ATP-binding protein [Clostridium sp. Cult2]
MFIKVENLTKKFGDLTAVDNLSFEVNKSELICLLGPSGCGKTTVLKIMGGFLKPEAGKIYIDGEDITSLPPEKRPVSTVFQSYALFPHMTVIQNVVYGLKFKGYSKKEALIKGEEYLDMVGLRSEKDKKVTYLSGGQQQRVALARSLIINPKVLLLDEPLSNLDAKLRIRMRDEIKEIQKKFNITMIFVTHDQEEALSIADRILIMNKGKLEQIGTPKEVYDKPKTEFVLNFIGSSNIVANNNYGIEFIRPERIIINKNKGDMEGIIEEKIFLGSIIVYKVKTKSNIYRIQKNNDGLEEFIIGDKVHISIGATGQIVQ